jgi:acyl carrier protein
LAPVITPEAAETVVCDALKSFGGRNDHVTRESTFEELDIDSLDIVELAQIIEDQLGVEIRGNEAKDLRTVGEVVDLIVERTSG